ncbi:MAG: TrkA family potassium uptake protein [Chloroflexi bacterium]|nr:TrkA family potassium uptake protein [Chloroflexota bacterium]
MYIIIVGGGKVGYSLSQELVAGGHEVLVIEKNKEKCERIADELGSIVLQGDGCEAATLAEAGCERSEVVVAVTGDDEDNLVICQMAKQKFGVPRTIARINNPKNRRIFELLGIDATVSTTELILSQIEQEIPTNALLPLLRLRHADLEIVEAKLSADAASLHKPLRELGIPPTCTVSVILRDGRAIIPGPDTELLPDDEVIAVCTVGSEEDLRSVLLR